ncbi:hypothetical protein EMPS_07573 [Entomortierella parvispora]|uniref:Uncharacterized protein n=1 Tax=Entomortierella parvispora TaxID=205924 RepID=A0A9P3HER1_9FUNG|nr:hypothetical protein EMPS_07573 [Entomortierella parvispora]
MPPLTPLEDELAEEEKVLRAEQAWFLSTQVEPNLRDIQDALFACREAAKLKDDAKGAQTLAISSPNNDILKGFVTLAGSYIVKGDMTIKLPKLPVVRAAIISQAPVIETIPAVATSASTADSSTKAGKTETNPSPEATGLEDAERGGEGQASNTPGGPSEAASVSTLTTAATASETTTTASEITGSTAPSAPSLQQQAVLPITSASKPPGHLTQPYFLEQLNDVRNHTDQAICRLEDYWGTPGLALIATTASSLGASEIFESKRALTTLLELVQRHLRAAIEAMAKPSKEKLYPFRVCDPKIFSPVLSEDFVIEFYIRDSQLVCAAYALQLTGGTSSGGGGIASYLQQALPSSTPSTPPIPASLPTLTSVTSVTVASDGHSHTSQMPQPPQAAYGHRPRLSSSSFTNVPSGGQGHADDHHAGKSGQATPRPTSPVLHHHSNAQQQQPQAGSGAKSYPWSPTRTPSSYQFSHQSPGDYQSSSNAAGPSGALSNDSVSLPPSSKVGQTSKGGINKYRGKIATTIEDKMVQVQSSKLSDINSRLVHAENLCRRMLLLLVLQESLPVHN